MRDCRLPGSKSGSGRWSHSEEIGWVHSQEIGWSHSQEIRGVHSQEILHLARQPHGEVSFLALRRRIDSIISASAGSPTASTQPPNPARVNRYVGCAAQVDLPRLASFVPTNDGSNAMPPTDLNVPFHEKDDAKRLGARWDAGRKTWFLPDGTEAAPFAK